MDYLPYVMDYLHSAMDYLHYAMDYSQYAMDYLRIIYDIDVLLSLSQDWVGRGIIFILVILMLLAVHCIAVFYF